MMKMWSGVCGAKCLIVLILLCCASSRGHPASSRLSAALSSSIRLLPTRKSDLLPAERNSSRIPVLILDVEALYERDCLIEQQSADSFQAVAASRFALDSKECNRLAAAYGNGIAGLAHEMALSPLVLAEVSNEVYATIDLSRLRKYARDERYPVTIAQRLLPSLPYPVVLVSNTPLFHVHRVLQRLGLTSLIPNAIQPRRRMILAPDPQSGLFKNDAAFWQPVLDQYPPDRFQHIVMDSHAQSLRTCSALGMRCIPLKPPVSLPDALTAFLCNPHHPLLVDGDSALINCHGEEHRQPPVDSRLWSELIELIPIHAQAFPARKSIRILNLFTGNGETLSKLLNDLTRQEKCKSHIQVVALEGNPALYPALHDLFQKLHLEKVVNTGYLESAWMEYRGKINGIHVTLWLSTLGPYHLDTPHILRALTEKDGFDVILSTQHFLSPNTEEIALQLLEYAHDQDALVYLPHTLWGKSQLVVRSRAQEGRGKGGLWGKMRDFFQRKETASPHEEASPSSSSSSQVTMDEAVSPPSPLSPLKAFLLHTNTDILPRFPSVNYTDPLLHSLCSRGAQLLRPVAPITWQLALSEASPWLAALYRSLAFQQVDDLSQWYQQLQDWQPQLAVAHEVADLLVYLPGVGQTAARGSAEEEGGMERKARGEGLDERKPTMDWDASSVLFSADGACEECTPGNVAQEVDVPSEKPGEVLQDSSSSSDSSEQPAGYQTQEIGGEDLSPSSSSSEPGDQAPPQEEESSYDSARVDEAESSPNDPASSPPSLQANDERTKESPVAETGAEDAGDQTAATAATSPQCEPSNLQSTTPSPEDGEEKEAARQERSTASQEGGSIQEEKEEAEDKTCLDAQTARLLESSSCPSTPDVSLADSRDSSPELPSNISHPLHSPTHLAASSDTVHPVPCDSPVQPSSPALPLFPLQEDVVDLDGSAGGGCSDARDSAHVDDQSMEVLLGEETERQPLVERVTIEPRSDSGSSPLADTHREGRVWDEMLRVMRGSILSSEREASPIVLLDSLEEGAREEEEEAKREPATREEVSSGHSPHGSLPSDSIPDPSSPSSVHSSSLSEPSLESTTEEQGTESQIKEETSAPLPLAELANVLTVAILRAGQVHIQSSPVPSLETDQVLVETCYSLVSPGVELEAFLGHEDHPQNASLAVGQCLVGRVRALADNLSPKDYLHRSVFVSAPHCTACIVHKDSLVFLPSDRGEPEDREESDATLLDYIFLPTVERAITLMMQASCIVGQRVCIVGQDLVGIITAATLKSCLPRLDLTLVETSPHRLAWSKAYLSLLSPNSTSPTSWTGLSYLSPDDEPPEDFDIALEVSGQEAGLQYAVDHTRRGGQVVIGSCHSSSPPASRSEVTLEGSYREQSLQPASCFHAKDIQIVTSQTDEIPAPFRAAWDKTRCLKLARAVLVGIRPHCLLRIVEKWGEEEKEKQRQRRAMEEEKEKERKKAGKPRFRNVFLRRQLRREGQLHANEEQSATPDPSPPSLPVQDVFVDIRNATAIAEALDALAQTRALAVVLTNPSR